MRTQILPNLVNINQPGFFDVNNRKLCTLSLQLPASFQYSGMLDRGCDEVLTTFRQIPHQAKHCQVIRFRAAAREHELGRRRMHKVCDGSPRIFELLPR